MPFLNYTKDFNDNLLMLLLRDHKRYIPIVEFFDNVTQGLSELTWAETEFIATEISRNNHSDFCSGIRKGVTNALLKRKPETFKGNKLEVVLAFALKVNKNASSIRQDDIQTVLNAGWSEQTIEDIIGLVAIQNLYNILATGLGFKGLPEAVFDEIGEGTVHDGGYTASFRGFINQTEQSATS